jgi:hypothetical protein
MSYIKLTDGVPEFYSIDQLRRDNPNTSFPDTINPETLEEFDVYYFKSVPAPQIDNKTHEYTKTVNLVDGEWTEVWVITELPLDQATSNIRNHRDSLLEKCDWITAKSYELGEPVPIEWVTYRQELRDITAQEGFPYSVIWPENPIEKSFSNTEPTDNTSPLTP